MTRIHAGFARVRRTVDGAFWLEAHADQLVAGIGLHWYSVVTRHCRRVTGQIRHLARVFVIAFARNHIGDGRGSC